MEQRTLIRSLKQRSLSNPGAIFGLDLIVPVFEGDAMVKNLRTNWKLNAGTIGSC